MNDSSDKVVVLIDGDCIFCNRGADLLARLDRHDRFRIAAQKSAAGAAIMKRFGVASEVNKTVVVIDGDKVFVRSGAMIRIADRLGGALKLATLAVMIPEGVRDAVYEVVASNRYCIAGKMACGVPSAELRARQLVSS